MSGSPPILQRSIQGNKLADLAKLDIKSFQVQINKKISEKNIFTSNFDFPLKLHSNNDLFQYNLFRPQLEREMFKIYNFIDIMNRQRPYRAETKSPYRESQDFYYPSNQGRSDLTLLEEENTILKLKCGKVSELQEKVDMVLKQNAQLLAQNEKMSRLLHQHKSENDILKNKIDNLSVQKMGFVNEFQMERKKLLMELERVADDMAELELQKNNQINEIKNAFQIQIQALKRQVHNSESSSEAELRKYRDHLDKREQEINDYATKLKRVTTETDYEILKLKEDKEKLKSEIEYNQADHAKQIQTLKNRLENNYLEELEALKRAHVKALDEAEKENIRIKASFQEKNRQTDQLSNKFNKQRVNMEDSINYLKRDNDALRSKIAQIQKMAQYEIVNMKDHLTNLHESEIDELISKQQGQIRICQDEIARLEDIINDKNNEIQQLIKDKVTNRSIFDSELIRVKQDYAVMIQKYKEQELKLSDVTNQSTYKVNDREKHIQYLENVMKDQKASFNSEQTALQKTIEVLKQEVSSERMAIREKDQNHKEAISDLKHQIEQLKLSSEQKEAELEKLITELKSQLNGTSANLLARVDSLVSQNKALEKENEALKNSLSLKEKEIKSLNERLRASGERQSRLQAQIDDLRNKLIRREKQSNESITEQKSRFESTYAYAIESMKSDHEAALRLEANKIRDLQEKLKKKELELDQLLRMYKKMTDQFQVLTEQQANKKDITLKYPGASADLMASKHLFDIYLKTKVLDVCGDALKENPKTF